MNTLSKITIHTIIILLSMNISNSFAQIKYPLTKKVSQTDNYFGKIVEDPYRWLENDKSEETAKWVQAENLVTQDYLAKIPFRAKIKESLSQLWNFEKYGLPEVYEKFIIYSKNDGMQNQSVSYLLNNDSKDAKVLLDPNVLSKDGTVALNDLSVSHNGKYIAYTIARSGSDWNEIYIYNVDEGTTMKDKLEWVKFSNVAWKGEGFYYSRYDAPKGSALSGKNENQKVYYHKIGSPQKNDVLIYEDSKFPLRNYSTITTDDERYLILSVTESTNGNILMVKRLADENAKFSYVSKDFENNYHIIGNLEDEILILTDKDAPNYRLVSINPMAGNNIDWRNLIPESKEEVLQSASLAGNKLIVTSMLKAKSKLTIHDYNGGMLKEILLPGIGTVGGVNGRMNINTAYFSFTSFTQPTTIYSMNTESLNYDIYFKPELPINTDDFVTDQVFYESQDGERVSMFIVHKKDIKLDDNNPVLLYGYGGFNISLTPSFSISRLFFLENGGVYAVPNLRGGGEYGRRWHQAGTLLQKQNTFNDFIAAAEFLIRSKYTNPSKLAISGGSNGGLLIGACMTQRPDLFKVALPAVGVLDMLRYHKFTIGWAWKTDYGCSDNEREFQYLYKYSPLHNIKKGIQYPATLITTADHDDRVVPAHSFKFAATLQEKQSGSNPVLIRIDSKAGHGAGKPTSKAIDEATDVWAFTFYNLGMKLNAMPIINTKKATPVKIDLPVKTSKPVKPVKPVVKTKK
ncbi:MAG: prolyl oligopeptidase family serine peptidase [Bacteroidetes bacterium]|nr:prolyl oligopeptidase family serine peptidase [Bacteroidota bacterium]